MPSKEDLLQALSLKKLRELAKENNVSLKDEWSMYRDYLTSKDDIVYRLKDSKKITIKKIQDKMTAPKSNKASLTKPKRRPLAKAERTLILKSQQHQCARCHKDISKITPHYDHRIPLAMGGSDTITNIQALCGDCHTTKTAQDKLEIARSKG